MRGAEFDIIAEHFAPLAKAKGAFGLLDDAALLPVSDYVVTKDMLIEGVHFLSADPIDQIARKLMRVNLSDLAAKGARPVGYFLAVAWPAKTRRADIAKFAEGLKADQDSFKVTLFGGDSTRHKGAAPLTLSATFFGQPARGGLIPRSGAAVGDDVWVSGSIGDAGLGLAALEKRETFPKADKEALVARFRLPEPRITLGGALAGIASAAIDISDGLLADAGHIAETSGVALRIEAERLPLSPAASSWRKRQEDVEAAVARLAGFGDDYEILFTAPTTLRRAVEMAGKVSKTSVTRIGDAAKGSGVTLHGASGEAIGPVSAGYDHFSD